jgi:hypothetical protein
MGTILPLASPFGSFGLPGLRFLWLTACELRGNCQFLADLLDSQLLRHNNFGFLSRAFLAPIENFFRTSRTRATCCISLLRGGKTILTMLEVVV